MSRELIERPGYWAKRFRDAPKEAFHQAIFRCSSEQWRKIEDRHRLLLFRKISPDDSILDVGCGWGRLLDLLPAAWDGNYLGIDLCPDFVHLAREKFLERMFVIADFRDYLGHLHDHQFDWAIMISIRPMIIRHLGNECWEAVERQLRRVCRRLLYLEYDPEDGGSEE